MDFSDNSLQWLAFSRPFQLSAGILSNLQARRTLNDLHRRDGTQNLWPSDLNALWCFNPYLNSIGAYTQHRDANVKIRNEDLLLNLARQN
jgi:hypothetical protein